MFFYVWFLNLRYAFLSFLKLGPKYLQYIYRNNRIINVKTGLKVEVW